MKKKLLLPFIILIISYTAVIAPFFKEDLQYKEVKFYPADTLFIKGRRYLETGRINKAERYIEIAVKIQPDYAPHHYYLGIIYEKLNKNKKAFKHYHRATVLDKEYFDANFQMAKFLKSMKQYSYSISYFKKSIILKPGSIKAYSGLYDIYIETGDTASAERVLKEIKKFE